MWAAGVAAGGVWVASQRIVGRGFDWLVSGTAAVLAGAGVWAGAGTWALVAAISAGVAVLVGGRTPLVASSLGVAAISGVVGAVQLGPWWLAVTGSVALGGITTEMLLGHWFLVDPRLPRSSLRALAGAGIAGAFVDTTVGLVSGIDGLLQVAAAAGLGGLTVVLMILVSLSLRERGYSGVMAATGLSYLAVLTGAGAVIAVRAALGGGLG